MNPNTSHCDLYTSLTSSPDINLDVHLYPNPGSSVVHIDIMNWTGCKKILVYNVYGQQVDMFTPDNSQIQLDVREYQAGAYVFVFLDAQYKVLSNQLFVKQ